MDSGNYKGRSCVCQKEKMGIYDHLCQKRCIFIPATLPPGLEEGAERGGMDENAGLKKRWIDNEFLDSRWISGFMMDF